MNELNSIIKDIRDISENLDRAYLRISGTSIKLERELIQFEFMKEAVKRLGIEQDVNNMIETIKEELR